MVSNKTTIHYPGVAGNGSGLRIDSLAALEEALPTMCQEILDALGKRNFESSYQEALKYDLEVAHVRVQSEAKIYIY